MPRKKKKASTLEEKLINRRQTLTNFHLKRLIQVSNDPQQVWELTKNPDNIFRLTEQELDDVLVELDRRLLNGEIDQNIKEKILKGVNQ